MEYNFSKIHRSREEAIRQNKIAEKIHSSARYCLDCGEQMANVYVPGDRHSESFVARLCSCAAP
jgi:hypothetical protein